MPALLRATGRVLARLGLVIGLGGGAGVLVAALALPLLGGAGLLAKQSAESFTDLPTDLLVPELAQRSLMLDADGNKIAELHGDQDRVIVAIKDVAPVMQDAIVAIEDSRFYEHHGVDYKGLARAAVRNQQAGEVKQGGSTLTQQYVKQVLLASASTDAGKKDAVARTTERKLQEARYALALEQRLSKPEILQRYLNIAYFGQGVYGVGAASTHYFGVQAWQLNLEQAALLAGLVNNPSADDPSIHPKAAKDRRDLVLERMQELGKADPAEVAAARALPIQVSPPVQSADACEGTEAAFFCDYVRRQLLDDPALGPSRSARADKLYSGGLIIKTTLDPRIQLATQAAIDSTIEPDNKFAASSVVVQPGTGQILAMAVNRRFGGDKKDPAQTKLNLPTDYDSFQVGSTMKAVTLVAALDKGISLQTVINAPGCYLPGGVNSDYKLTADQLRGLKNTPGASGCAKSGGLSNAGDALESGPFNLRTGTADSVNTFFLQLEEKVGRDGMLEAARQLGLPAQRMSVSKTEYFTLGAVEMSALEMASGYATLAAHGTSCASYGVVDVQSVDGKPVPYTRPVGCQQTLPANIADTATQVLRGPVSPGGTAGANADIRSIGRPVSGKTGTTDNSQGAWFVGYTPQLAISVGIAEPNFPNRPDNALVNVTIGGKRFPRAVFGGDVPASIFAKAIKGALDGVPVEQFAPLDKSLDVPVYAVVPNVVGKTVAQASGVLGKPGFGINVQFGDKSPNAVITAQGPGGGARVPVGTLVGVSTLPLPPPPPPPPTPEPTVAPPSLPPTTPGPPGGGFQPITPPNPPVVPPGGPPAPGG